jgi:excisionase family DNA binding protein
MRLPDDLDPAGPDMTVSQLAECLGLSERTIYRYLDANHFPGAYLVGSWHIPQKVVMEYIISRTRLG